MQNEIFIDGAIDSGLARQVKEALTVAAGQPVTVRINSEGGSVFEGLAIYDALMNYPGQVTTVVESAALSMGSVIALAGDDVQATANAYVMIHSPHLEDDQDLEDADRQLLATMHEKMADIYEDRTGLSLYEIEELMKAERFMDAEEAKELGFVDTILEPTKRSKAKASRMMQTSAKYRKHVVASTASRVSSIKAEFNQAIAAAKAANIEPTRVLGWVDRKYPGLRARYIRANNI